VDQTRACKHLFASVIAMAIKDACSKTDSLHIPALHFLFYEPPNERLDSFLYFLDIDASHFRIALLKFMNSTVKARSNLFIGVSQKEKDRFNKNYETWVSSQKYWGNGFRGFGEV
jgi:hypothetical protein